jgi:uncharacterized small protein (DUF1192 family)
LQHREAEHLGVLGVQELRERQQVVDEGLDRLLAQHGAAQRDVTKQAHPDLLGHRDGREPVLEACA